MFEISIKSQFCGAHFLKGYKGQCANLHGHNWEVEVFLRGPGLNSLGMLVDYKRLKELLQEIFAEIDHQNLNSLTDFKRQNPTAENIAKFVFNRLSPGFRRTGCRLDRVRVSETAGTSAIFGPRL